MSHHPDHKPCVRRAAEAWMRDDIEFPGKMKLMPYIDLLVDRVCKELQQATKQDQKTS